MKKGKSMGREEKDATAAKRAGHSLCLQSLQIRVGSRSNPGMLNTTAYSHYFRRTIDLAVEKPSSDVRR